MAKKLTPQQIAIVSVSTDSNSVLANRFGVHHKTVEKARKGVILEEDKITPNVAKEDNVTILTLPEITPEVTGNKGRRAEHYPTTAYKDGENGVVLTLECPDGWIPEGWHDSPADCDNCIKGTGHPKYEKVKI